MSMEQGIIAKGEERMVALRIILITITILALISDLLDIRKRDTNDYMTIIYFVLVIVLLFVR